MTLCEYLDASSNTWRKGPPMVHARFGHGLVVVDGQLWAVGGFTSQFGALMSCERLDNSTNVWVAAPYLPIGVINVCCVVK